MGVQIKESHSRNLLKHSEIEENYKTQKSLQKAKFLTSKNIKDLGTLLC